MGKLRIDDNGGVGCGGDGGGRFLCSELMHGLSGDLGKWEREKVKEKTLLSGEWKRNR